MMRVGNTTNNKQQTANSKHKTETEVEDGGRLAAQSGV
jgi:hypothetical protein